MAGNDGRAASGGLTGPPSFLPNRAAPLVAGLLLFAEIVTLGVVGVRVIRETPVFGPIDERSHYSYVQFLAEEGRLPLLRDAIRPEVTWLARGTYPEPSGRPADLKGVWGRIYEAFQPPLYYLLAAPVSRLTPDHRMQVTVLRSFDLALLVVAALTLLVLCRICFAEEWLYASGHGLIVLLLPGIVVRSVHVGNACLEIVLGLLFFACLLRGLSRGTPAWICAAGPFLGATLLTRLTASSLGLVFALGLLVAWRRGIVRTGHVLIAWVLVLGVVAPWLVFNLDHYGSLTANAVARGMQRHVINPEGIDYGLEHGLRHLFDQLFSHQQMVLPQEAPFALGSLEARAVVVASVVWFVVPLARWPLGRSRAETTDWSWLLGWALPLSLGVCVIAYVSQDWPMLVRYTYVSFPAAMVFGYGTMRRWVGPGGTLALSVASYGFVVWVWTRAPFPW